MSDKKGVIKAMLFASAVFAIGLAILGWQYQKLEKNKIPLLEAEIEKNAAYSVVQRFMDLRIDKNQIRAERFLTEVAMEEYLNGSFSLIDGLSDYEIMRVEKVEEEEYRFLVKVIEEGRGNYIEAIDIVKILDSYYVNSVELAG